MAVDARYRDKDGEISRKHGNVLVGRLRTSYGGRFAQGCANDDKLSDVLAKLDERSLYKLVRDYKSGMLPIRSKDSLDHSAPAIRPAAPLTLVRQSTRLFALQFLLHPLRERTRRSSRSYCPGKNGKEKTVCPASSVTIITRDRSL